MALRRKAELLACVEVLPFVDHRSIQLERMVRLEAGVREVEVVGGVGIGIVAGTGLALRRDAGPQTVGTDLGRVVAEVTVQRGTPVGRQAVDSVFTLRIGT